VIPALVAIEYALRTSKGKEREKSMKTQIVKAKHILASLVLLVVLLAATSCALPGTTASPVPVQPPAVVPTNPSPPTLASPAPISPSLPPVDSNTPSPFPDFVSVIAEVRPSVVAITTEVPGYNIFGSSYTQQGAGSGWIIDKDGLIVTNNHVVEGAKSITVTLEDGRTFPAKSVHTDSVADLAVIKINAQNLPALRIGDSSKLNVGERVVAIGNSLGMGISATEGIVSAVGVSLSISPGETLSDLIQTDAAINPGNSGGPLVNLLGEVVGINSAKVAQVGVEGMGYAISVKEATSIIDQLIKNGYVIRPYLGVSTYTVDQFVAFRYGLGVDKGVLVTQVARGSPADKAGIMQGDVIAAIEDKEINDASGLIQAINSYQIGQKIKIAYWRGRAQNTTFATLVQSPLPGQ
jgi:serine protease Do